MKVREVIKFLVENNGWYLVRISGSHRQFKLRSKRSRLTINCKMDKELPEGALFYSLKHCFDHEEVTQKDHYEITIEQSHNCFSAYCPDLPGCVAVGDTLEETKELMLDSLRLHLEGLRQDGVLVAEPVNTSAFFEIRQAS
ncbi:MAG TPA: type II toxin-antitoxin system HicA family toxin [Thermodesulfobacteriota bacterium]|nr:type II toxin-antitoxin system HicA family toxin [Thermodesulfobacteriota bacterium]